MIVSWAVRTPQIIRALGWSLLIFVCWDFFVVIGEMVMGWSWISWPSIPLALYGAAIGLLVSFRNGSTYNRWWEARTLWGAIVNKSRTFARQVLNTISPGEGATEQEKAEVAALQRRLVLYQVAYVHVLRQQLRGLDPVAQVAQSIPNEDIHGLAKEKNVALALQRKMGEMVTAARRRGWLNEWEWQAIDGSLSALMDAQGGAERIKNTPMPRQYDFLARLFVLIYCVLLPVGLVESLKWFTPVGSVVVGIMFMGLDKIGRDLENPFDNSIYDVPVTAIATTIEINLRQLIGETELPDPVKPVEGVLW
jgi:ion channel-forming bestrophin family protein